MAIVYPLSLPSVGGFARATFHMGSAVAVSTSPFTFHQQAQAHAGQRWTAEFVLGLMVRADAEQWAAEFFAKLNGKEGTFLAGDPFGATPRGTAGGAPVVNGASQTGNTLVTSGWAIGATFLAGDYLQLGSGAGARLHKNLEDVTADGGGNATLTIWPKLRASPANGAAITVTGAKGVFRLASNDNAWDVDRDGHYAMAFGAMEKL